MAKTPGTRGNRNLQQYPSAAPDRGGITAFRDSTALRPPRQLSGVDYEAVGSPVIVDPSWGLVLGRPESECVGRIRVPRDESRSGGQAPAARIPSEPGAACVTDRVCFPGRRTVPALDTRSAVTRVAPRILPHANPSRVGGVRSVGGSGDRRRLPPGLPGAEDRPAADQPPPGPCPDGLRLRGVVGRPPRPGVAGPAVGAEAAPGARDPRGTPELGATPGDPPAAVGRA